MLALNLNLVLLSISLIGKTRWSTLIPLILPGVKRTNEDS